MLKRTFWSTLTIIILFALIPQPVLAYWVDDGNAVYADMYHVFFPKMAADGNGGVIITWADASDGSTEVYAQRLDGSGNLLWGVDGIRISDDVNSSGGPEIISDGAGGAIICWNYYGSSNTYLMAQRIDSEGLTQWSVGIPVCFGSGNQQYQNLCSDGSGGAIITWVDDRDGNNDIYAQRISGSGYYPWGYAGLAICQAANDQDSPQIISREDGGTIITWEDARGADFDVYAQRLNSDGTRMWTAGGVAVCNESGNQNDPLITYGPVGGAIIVWEDDRNSNPDLYAQRLHFNGTLVWASSGIAVCSNPSNQNRHAICSDDSGGAIVAWEDNRNAAADTDIYAQRIDENGDPLWESTGIAVSAAYNHQVDVAIAPDGAGGAILAWEDYRSTGLADIYAGRVDAGGTVMWADNGVPVCTIVNYQEWPRVAGIGTSGAVVLWTDSRSSYFNVYAHYITRGGEPGALPPEIVSARDVPGDEGGSVFLSWDASPADIALESDFTDYSVWRAIDPLAAMLSVEKGAILLSSAAEFDQGTREPIVRSQLLGSTTYYWEYVNSQDAYGLISYGMPVETMFDSTAVSDEYHYFQVIAHTSDPAVFWISEPDSGYSVDNLAPCPPLALSGEQQFSPEGLLLTWTPNTEPDLDCYRVYRGTSESFEPDAGNLVGAPCDTMTLDGSWSWEAGYWYKVAAVDIHGNESVFAVLGPDMVTGDDPMPAPNATFLAQNWPNPFNPNTTIAFGLETSGHVSLRIYDAAGRLVRVLIDESRSAGQYAAVWNGKDRDGNPAASGVYFYMLKAGTFEETRKMILLR